MERIAHSFMEEKKQIKKDLWFVAQTIPHVELKMRKYFEDRGIECFVPTKIETRKREGKMTDTEIPIIENLVFFKADYTMANSVFSLNYRMINRLRDSKGLLAVSDSQMNLFMCFINQNCNKVRILNSCHVPGDWVKVRKGPLAGLVGKLACVDNVDCFAVSLGRVVMAAVKFPKSNLIKVAETDPQTV